MKAPPRWARAIAAHPIRTLGLVAALTAALGAQAVHVRPDYSVELLFPVWNPSRKVYDRFKQAFPHEDTRAVVIVEAGDVLERSGLSRLRDLERELAGVRGVQEVVGPTTARTVTLEADGIALTPILPGPEVDDVRLAYGRDLLTRDPLFAWNVARPDGSSASISLRLDPAIAGTAAGRQALVKDLRAVLARHEAPGQALVLSGVPVLRAGFAEMIEGDVGTLVPAALAAVVVLLLVAFRSPGAVLAALGAILASLAWTYGVLGALGYPLSMMVSILPILVVIICVSDAVHLAHHYLDARRSGLGAEDAAARALAEGAIPCLLTEVVLACGFLSLVAVNITAIFQFGVAAAICMVLIWLANVTVVPAVLVLGKVRAPRQRDGRPGPTWALQRVDGFAAWIGRQLLEHPRRIVAGAVLLLACAAAIGSRVSTTSYVFDDLRKGSRMERDLRAAEAAHGGVLPLVLYIEGTEPGAALDPELVRLADRGAAMLRSIPEVGQANSLADYLRHGARALSLPDPLSAGGLTPDAERRTLSRAVDGLADPHLLDDVLSKDRRALAVPARVLDCGSGCIDRIFAGVDAWIASEQAALSARPGGPKARIYATSQARLFKDVNDTLMQGLAGSFGSSLLISFVVMCVLLRSWRLGVIGLIPNVAPLVLVVAFMSLAGIALKPVTVVLFSLALVIAEDDTIQLLSRLRLHYERAAAEARPGEDPHRAAAVACMREVALPILVTSMAVSGGFLLLLFSRFLAPADLGLLIGATLFAAVFADLFLTPLLVIRLRPFAARRAAPAAQPEVAS